MSKTETKEKIIILQTTKENLLSGLDKAVADYSLAGLTSKDGKTLYDFVGKSSELIFDYAPTVLSPKKFFFPQDEVILDYTDDGKVVPRIEAKAMVLFGVRPCDISGIKIMDEAFAAGAGDPNYLAKREKSIVIGLDCSKLCDDNAFCYRVNTQNTVKGSDLMLHDLGEQFAVSVITEKGKNFAEKYLNTDKGNEKGLESFAKEKEKGFGKVGPFKDLDKLPEVFENNKEHKVWGEEGSRCLSCGSCIMVCPTCYCFDVADELALSLKKGERIRRWDACMLSPFAEVAGGENFREHANDRLQHRISRKFNWLMKKHEKPVCVGCGRCVKACLAEISPEKIVMTLTGEKD